MLLAVSLFALVSAQADPLAPLPTADPLLVPIETSPPKPAPRPILLPPARSLSPPIARKQTNAILTPPPVDTLPPPLIIPRGLARGVRGDPGERLVGCDGRDCSPAR